MLEKDIVSLNVQVDRLNLAVGRGEYNRETTRAVQLIDNPASKDLAIRQATLDGLKAENKALLERLANLAPEQSTRPTKPLEQDVVQNTINPQANGEEITPKNSNTAALGKEAEIVSGSVPQETYDNILRENEELLKELEAKEKAKDRLKEVGQLCNPAETSTHTRYIGIPPSCDRNARRHRSAFGLQACF